MNKRGLIRIAAMLTLIAGIAAIAAGCGSSDDGTGGGGGGGYASKGGGAAADTTAPSPEKTGAAVVSAASVPKLGRLIVDSKGHTLYDFHKDKGTSSSCYGGCEALWPPLSTEGEPQAGNGAEASKLGTTRRKDGSTQVTYAGHPLYTYAEDKGPGEANGNDIDSFGAEWYALEPSGSEPED
jgi:predicted lipoprotein with Yx(FWY)xxD motif